MPNPVKVPAKVIAITKIGDGVYHISFQPLVRKPRFFAGQFLHLALDPYDPTEGFWPESRVFSIASSPSSTEVDIVYSVKGAFTRRMESELSKGIEVWLKFPYGDFIIPQLIDTDSTVILIAGGTGISPFLPFLSDNMLTRDIPKIRLYWGMKSPGIYNIGAAAITQLCNDEGHDVHLFCEIPFKDVNDARIHFTQSSMIDIDKILYENGTLDIYKYFISGPPTMIKAFKSILLEGGIEADNIFIDDWE